jgi:hypothetical protein
MRAAVLLALAFAALPCAAAPLEFPLPSAAPPTPVVPSGIRDYPTAAQAIVQVLTTRMHLPMPTYRMEVYADPAEFEAALVRHLKISPQTARVAAGFAKAAVGNRRILVNETLMAKSQWPERLVTLAHEMVHVTQLELSGHRSLVRQQWLVEGFAEWAAFAAVDALGVRPLAAERASMQQRVRAAREQVGLARLAELDTFDQWVRSRDQRGFDAAYPFAYLATDFLVERHSYDRLLAYFRLYRNSSDPAANFEAAFGESLEQFQQALDAQLAR